MYNWLEQTLFVIQWLVILFVVHISVWSWIKRHILFFAYPISFTFSIILLGLISWWLGVLHLPIWIAILPFILHLFFVFRRNQLTFIELQSELKWDLIFVIFFFSMIIAQMRNSAIFAHERFLDMGIIASIMRNPIVPPLDPQYLGGNLNIYYYFSHWIFGTLGILSQVPPPIVYNLILPTVLALSAVSCYAIGYLVIPRYPYLPLFLLIIPRPSLLFCSFTEGTENLIRTFSSSVLQIIPNTANDYPLDCFLSGIPHPHVNALAIQLLFILLITLMSLKWSDLEISGRRLTLCLTGCTAGCMVGINSWDSLVYFPLLAGLILYVIYTIQSKKLGNNLNFNFLCNPDIHSIFLMIVVAISVIIPFIVQMQQKSIDHIGIVQEQTPIIPFLLVHGWYLFIIYIFTIPEIKKKPHYLLIAIIPVIFGYWGIALLLIPLLYLITKSNHSLYDYFGSYVLLFLIVIEVFYLGEVIDSTSRFNTVFKLGLALWPLTWIAVFGMIFTNIQKQKIIPHIALSERRAGIFSVIFICLIFIIIPLGSCLTPPTLDGREYLELYQPDDAKVIEKLEADNMATGIIEATGDYDYHARIAAFTGVPTIIGWPSIETQWGRSKEDVERRVADVETFYHNPEQTLSIINRYNCSHIIIGNFEMLKYGDITINPYGLEPELVSNSTVLIKKTPKFA